MRVPGALLEARPGSGYHRARYSALVCHPIRRRCALPERYDVVVVGAGNAALSAALAAKEICGSVLVAEKAPEYFRGGNTYFTGGLIRFAFNDLEDIKTLIPDMSPTEEASVDVGSYTQDQFYADMMRVTQGMADPELAQILVSQSLPAMQWLREKGVRFVLSYGRQAFKDGDKFRFWGGLLLEAVGAGKGLSDQQFEAAHRSGVEVRYSTQGVSLIRDEWGTVCGLRVLGARRLRGHRRPGRGACRGGVRVQRRNALPVPGTGLGVGQGPGHTLQHRRRNPHGSGRRGPGSRALERLSCRGLGHERAAIRRPHRH